MKRSRGYANGDRSQDRGVGKDETGRKGGTTDKSHAGVADNVGEPRVATEVSAEYLNPR